MATGESTRVIVIALAANVGIAIAQRFPVVSRIYVRPQGDGASAPAQREAAI